MSQQLEQYELDATFGCHLFTGKLDKDGYGLSYRGKTMKRAHIAAWEAANGPIAKGLELEHECRRRRCVNPEHLRLVTRSENEKLKQLGYRVKIATCRRGHDLKLYAMVTPEGGRVCRMCKQGDRR